MDPTTVSIIDVLATHAFLVAGWLVALVTVGILIYTDVMKYGKPRVISLVLIVIFGLTTFGMAKYMNMYWSHSQKQQIDIPNQELDERLDELDNAPEPVIPDSKTDDLDEMFRKKQENLNQQNQDAKDDFDSLPDAQK